MDTIITKEKRTAIFLNQLVGDEDEGLALSVAPNQTDSANTGNPHVNLFSQSTQARLSLNLGITHLKGSLIISC